LADVRTTDVRTTDVRIADVRTTTDAGPKVLVVMGERDPDFPDPKAEARFVADALNGDVLLVPDAGHYPMVEYPEIVNPAIVAFAGQVYAVA
jgi:pimeloyl-ACP methyl ester carboxylesterase